MTSYTINSTYVMNNNVNIPVFGLGVWKATSEETYNAVRYALDVGYRMIDTAWIYGNEVDVGKAIRDSKVPREDIFVTTKLWRDHHDNPQKAFESSMQNLNIGYIDLYLSHFPEQHHRISAYKFMETLLSGSRCKAIGVSNYTVRHLDELLSNCDVVPAINQVEFHPFLNQKELAAYCTDKKIQIEAYSPLTHGQELNNETIVSMATKYSKTPAQILIRWCIENNLVVIPKSKTPSRILENSEVFDFEIAAEDLEILNSLNKDLRTCWDPTDAL